MTGAFGMSVSMTCAVISVLSMLVGIVIGIPIGIELARGHGHRGVKP